MAKVSGEVLTVNSIDAMLHPVGADVVAVQGRRPVGVGKVDRDNRFEIELADGVIGLVEVRLGLTGGSVSTFEADGTDQYVVIYFNPINNFIA